jgi:glycerol-3-phosphate acyltransferase PlsY
MSAAAAWALGAGVFPLAGYFVGSVPFGLLAGRAKGIDIRSRGSGNLGATNAWRVLGWRWGLGVFLLDVLKGLTPTLAAGLFLKGQSSIDGPALFAVWLMTALGAILGHVFPVWLRFRGGKGVATSLGVVLGVWPYYALPGLAAVGVWSAVTFISRYVSLGSICAAVVFPVTLMMLSLMLRDSGWRLDDIWPLVSFALAMPLLVIYRHRSNIVRLLNGTENRIGESADPDGDGDGPRGT